MLTLEAQAWAFFQFPLELSYCSRTIVSTDIISMPSQNIKMVNIRFQTLIDKILKCSLPQLAWEKKAMLLLLLYRQNTKMNNAQLDALKYLMLSVLMPTYNNKKDILRKYKNRKQQRSLIYHIRRSTVTLLLLLPPCHCNQYLFLNKNHSKTACYQHIIKSFLKKRLQPQPKQKSAV